ncbi:MAG: glycosyltransferase, partial [Candidatus Binatia bacterium]
MENEPIISIVVPTHNRRASLKRTLDALCLQTYPVEQMELLVVADGCTDETPSMLREYRAPFSLKSIEQPNQGAAAARNRGAEEANGTVLLFLDDDVEPTPRLVEAHARAHQHKLGQVVIGPYPLARKSHADFFVLAQRAWWDAIFDAMGETGHRFAFTDLLGGNFSIEPGLFVRVGRFSPAFRCHEDHELGIRLLKAGAQFFFAPDALGYHHEQDSLNCLLARKYQEGRADVQIARLYPGIRAVLPLAHYRSAPAWLNRFLRILAFATPKIGDPLARCFQHVLSFLENVRLRDSWKQLQDALKDYWYWRGVAEEISRRTLTGLFDRNQVRSDVETPEVELDLREGLDRAESRLDEKRPDAIRICYAGRHVGFVFPQPGAEPLRGAHLRSILTKTFAGPVLEAMVLLGNVDDFDTVERPKLAKLVRVRSSWFGQVRSGKAWSEQYAQWLRLEGRESEEPALFWEQQARISHLENEKTGLSGQLNYWRYLAEEREKSIQKQQLLISELERDKT